MTGERRNYNVKQCDEIRRAVFFESLAKARNIIAMPVIGEYETSLLNALAAIAEACGNDLTSDSDEIDD